MSEPETPKLWTTLWRTYCLGWRHPGAFVGMLLTTLAIAGLTGGAFYILKIFIELMSGAETAIQGGNDKLLTTTAEEMKRMAIYILPLGPIAAAAAWGSWYLGQWLANRCMQELRSEFLERLVNLDLGFHTAMAKGDLITRMSADMTTMQSLVQLLYSKLFQRTLEIFGVIVVCFFIDVKLATVLAIICIPIAFILGSQFKRTRKRSQKARETLADTLVVMEQVTSGIRVIKAMGSNVREKERYETANAQLFADNMRVAKSRSNADATSNGLVFLLTAGALFGGAILFAEKAITPAVLASFLAAIGRLATLARTTQRAWGEVYEQIPAVERIFAIMDRPSAITDAADATECPAPETSLSLDNVTFAYTAGDEPVLNQCSLEIPVGHTVALVGESGAGKSTILDLLPRFFDVNEGAVRFDGADIKTFTTASLIRHFSIVQQTPYLFNDTVLSNIAYGRPGASREDIETAAKRAHVHEAIMALEGGLGYDTVVGDRGERLSGGQRQRVAIARALLRDAPILLLDEPTSALDADSESHVQQALDELMKGRTCIIVAHRLATIQNADTIHVLDKAHHQVVESGSHDELLKAGGEYARLVSLQQLRDGEVSGDSDTESQ